MLTLSQYRNDLTVFSRVTTVPSENNYNRSVRVLLHLWTQQYTFSYILDSDSLKTQIYYFTMTLEMDIKKDACQSQNNYYLVCGS